MLGAVGGTMAIIGIIVLPITSGDTALRGLRLMTSEFLKIEQKTRADRLKISLPIFAVVAAILVWAKFSPGGFTILWRYFAWSNQTIAVFAFAMIAVYLLGKGHTTAFIMPLIPGAWYVFITSSYILSAKIGFNIPMNISYVIGIALALAYCFVIYRHGINIGKNSIKMEADPVYD